MPPDNVDLLTTVYGPTTWDVYDKLDQSLSPAGPDELFEIAGALLSPGFVVLDAGCRDAGMQGTSSNSYEASTSPGSGSNRCLSTSSGPALPSTRHRCRTGSRSRDGDPVDADSRRFGRSRLVPRRLRAVDDVDGALAQLGRVMKPGAPMVLFTTVVTDSLNSNDRAILRGHMGNIDENLDRPWLEQRFVSAGFEIDAVRSVGTEWREHAEARTQPVSTALLRLARLRRRTDEIVADHGQAIFNHLEANLHWELFQFLGKLDPLSYTLRHPAPA